MCNTRTEEAPKAFKTCSSTRDILTGMSELPFPTKPHQLLACVHLSPSVPLKACWGRILWCLIWYAPARPPGHKDADSRMDWEDRGSVAGWVDQMTALRWVDNVEVRICSFGDFSQFGVNVRNKSYNLWMLKRSQSMSTPHYRCLALGMLFKIAAS